MKIKIISYVAAVALGAALCMYFDKDVHEIQEKIVFKDRTRTVVKEVIKENPDGSRTVERETTKDEKKDAVASRTETKPVKKNWIVGVKYDLLRPEPAFTVDVNRRILGDFYLGVYGRTDGVFGVGVLFSF